MDPALDEPAFAAAVDTFRRELVVHCYRMSGSVAEAEEIVQEALLRAWQRRESFQGRSSVRRWLYAIATNGAIDHLRARRRRDLPQRSGTPSDAAAPMPPPIEDAAWIEPLPDRWLGAALPEPDARIGVRDSVRLAFVAALGAMPPRQRAVLLLVDVLGWSPAEVASHLETTVSSVRSALDRARASVPAPPPAPGPRDAPAVERFVEAWERRDLDALATLLKDDVVLAMPPVASWYRGRAQVLALVDAVLGPPGTVAARPVPVNGAFGVALWQRDPAGSGWVAVGVQVLEVVDGQIAEIVAFLGATVDPAPRDVS